MRARTLSIAFIMFLASGVNSCSKEEEPYDEGKTLKVGCMDRGAFNYDPEAKKECENCCVYQSTTPK